MALAHHVSGLWLPLKSEYEPLPIFVVRVLSIHCVPDDIGLDEQPPFPSVLVSVPNYPRQRFVMRVALNQYLGLSQNKGQPPPKKRK